MRIVPIESLQPWNAQPRRQFLESSLKELAESIRSQGMINPLTVRPVEGGFQIVIGERRWRAALLLGMREVPVIVQELDDRAALILSLVENLQREDLSLMDRARGIRRLYEQLGNWAEVGKLLGFGSDHVEGMARPLTQRRMFQLNALNDLPQPVQEAIEAGDLNEKHGRALGRVKDQQEQEVFLRTIQEHQLSGPETERLLKLVQEEAVGFEEGVSRVRPARVMRSLHERLEDTASDFHRLLRQSMREGTPVEGTLGETIRRVEVALKAWKKSKG